MDILYYLSAHHDQAFYLLGGVSLMIELSVIGFGSPLLFIGIAAFITGILSSFGIVVGWEYEIFSLGLVTAVITLLLWKPLKNFQNSGGGPDTSSDMIGQEVVASTDITSVSGTIRHSGIDWQSRLDSSSDVDSIDDGSLCVITGVKGTVMIVNELQA